MKMEAVCSCESSVPVCQVTEGHDPGAISSNNVMLPQLSTGESFEVAADASFICGCQQTCHAYTEPDDDLSGAKEYVNAVK